MKNTLSVLVTLAGISAAQDVTFSSSATNNGFGALDFSISENSWLSQSNNEWDYSTQQYGRLNSVTLYIYPAGYSLSNMTTGFGIGIYEKRVSGDTTTWVLLGKTDWLSGSSNLYMNIHTFQVQDDITLAVDRTYTMAFIAGSDYFNSLTPGSIRNSMSGATCWPNDQPLSTTTTLAAIGILKEEGDATGTVILYGAGNSGEITGYTPYAAVNVTPYTYENIMPVNVPEPTTATLGLLALASLAARRRRA